MIVAIIRADRPSRTMKKSDQHFGGSRVKNMRFRFCYSLAHKMRKELWETSTSGLHPILLWCKLNCAVPIGERDNMEQRPVVTTEEFWGRK